MPTFVETIRAIRSLPRTLLLVPMLTLAVACTPVSFFFSESASDRFGNIWMTVKSIALINSDEEKVFIYGDPGGTVININGGEDIAELFSLRSIPEGTYTELEVTFDPTVMVTDENGEQAEHQLDGLDAPGRFVIPCLHLLEDDTPGAVVIGFDLEALVVTGDQLSIEPAMGCQNSNGIANLAKHTARWHGTVLEVAADENSFVLGAQFWHRDVEITVVLNPAGAVFDEETGDAEDSVAMLSEGDLVRVFGGFDFTTFTLDAESVSKKVGGSDEDSQDDDTDSDDDNSGGENDGAGPGDDGQGNGSNGQGNGQDNGNGQGNDGNGNGQGGGQGSGDGSGVDNEGDLLDPDDDDTDRDERPGGSAEIEGTVVTWDGGSTLVIDVDDANFVAPDTVTVAGISDARFQRGSMEIVALDQELQLRGSWDGMVFNPKFVNIVGATPGQSQADSPLTRVDGTVTAIDGTQVTLEVHTDDDDDIEPMDDDPAPETEISFDSAEVFIARGRQSCLDVGAEARVWGSFSDIGFDATRLQIKGNCKDKEEDEGDQD